jgi:aminopeptidase N
MSKDKKVVKLSDYRVPAYLIPETVLEFEIFDDRVVVQAELNIEAHADTVAGSPLVLDGERLKLISVAVDGRELSESEYELTDESMIIAEVPRSFKLSSIVEIDPYHNTWLEGIYKSGNILCSQNEPHGFRKITYFVDRPDIMSSFRVGITADAKHYPYLLSNGNQVKSEDLGDGRQRVVWHDPFPKPCYLFALVAGDFALREDSFTTASGREIRLQIYVDHGNSDRVAHTMESLKKSMRWDEETFGLEYDLDVFMIVAVDAFNMGAMENKGLNIFNSACALANPQTATDQNFMNVENIVAHEYFHNWTGDRITLRDWFQLTLKEGLTVYRDTEYMSDMYSRAIRRIESARGIRSVQFAEDAGPNAHPIKPESYQEINNFYTSTVYQKGAEVIRMLRVLLGQDGFLRGMRRYVELFDGKAITTEDFLHAMESANGCEFTTFRRWYNQAGTPVCRVSGDYDAATETFRLRVKQSCAPTADASPKEPFCMPMIVGMLDEDGNDLPLRLEGETADKTDSSRMLVVDQAEQEFVFAEIKSAPVPSLFRDFSAPVKLEYNYTRADLIFLFKHDSDAFNRYDAGQRLALDTLLNMVADLQSGGEPQVDSDVLDAFGGLINDADGDLAYQAHALVLPSTAVINQELDVFDFENVFVAREMFKTALAQRYQDVLRRRYADCASGQAYHFDAESMARRMFRGLCLDLLSYLDDGAVELAFEQFRSCDNMTERMSALQVLCNANTPQREQALAEFLESWRDDFNVVNKWFAVQASACRNTALYENVSALAKHDLFDAVNPNRLRSVYGAFAGCSSEFHHKSGRGYKLIADIAIATDSVNSQVSAGLAKTFKHYKKLAPELKSKMREQLERIIAIPDISIGLQEIVSKTLADD